MKILIIGGLVALKEPSLAWEQDLEINTQSIRDELNYRELYSPSDTIPMQMDHHLFDYHAEDNALVQVS